MLPSEIHGGRRSHIQMVMLVGAREMVDVEVERVRAAPRTPPPCGKPGNLPPLVYARLIVTDGFSLTLFEQHLQLNDGTDF